MFPLYFELRESGSQISRINIDDMYATDTSNIMSPKNERGNKFDIAPTENFTNHFRPVYSLLETTGNCDGKFHAGPPNRYTIARLLYPNSKMKEFGSFPVS